MERGSSLKNIIRKYLVFVLSLILLSTALIPSFDVCAKGPTYTAMQDVYYTKDNCVVYAEPTYTSMVLTTIGANIPVQVIGHYSNGWYRINIGVICYVKMDSLTTAGAIGIANNEDRQILDAQKTAAELGYEFVYLTLNNEKTIKKDIYNSYVGKKVILYTKLDDELAVSFKMLYNDKVKQDINLNMIKVASPTATGGRQISYHFVEDTILKGQLAIFQFRVGYDKEAVVFTEDLQTGDIVQMMTYYTEFSEFAYAPVTQIAYMNIIENEVEFSLTDNLRAKMANIRKGIKYIDYDTKEYFDSLHSRLRKDTEYMDYYY